MKSRTKVTIVAGGLAIALFAGSIISRRQVERQRGNEATLEDVLFLPSGKTVKRLSLGYSGLLADIYWTRAVQYFGSKHLNHSQQYSLLYPLLDITTDLDPKLIVAYEYGSVFLSQKPPDGAGQPDKAVALVEKGIRANPEYWRLYFTLGFVHYIDRHDLEKAQAAFEKGSRVPGALPWMKVMAARMAEHRKDINTSIMLWQAVYETTPDKDVKATAQLHLDSLQAERDISELERRVESYRQRTGNSPSSWGDLIRGGVIPGVPLAPKGEPYVLKPGGKVDVADSSKYRYLGEWRGNQELPF
ncbi:MAG TPA: hypothetical protein VH724_03050 [Candidatus Angelobacter sp.]|jgi:tetratricopeptide (TPR) repeat protein|nr:hypothetical protein [Candidatus Angelobacter sp.]